LLILLICCTLLALVVPLKTMLSSSPSSAAPKGWTAQPFFRVSQEAASTDPSGLSPSQIRAAYNLPSTGGSGTIAIVDAYDDPTIQNDLTVFCNQFGLPAANFSKHEMSSGIPTDGGWALEMSLDVEWSHAIAPNATILLVEATSNGNADLLAAVDYARETSGVVAVSMSWGGSEFSGESSDDSHFTSSYGASFFASSGDTGGVVSWPAVSANVVGVGGTTLTLAANGSVSSETAWGGSGGGPSAYVAEPSYQVTYGVKGTSGKRGVPDVSYDANVSTGVSVYDSTPYDGSSGWWIVGGTSAGAPQWAAIQSLGLSAKDSNFYVDAKSASYSSYFRDITSGSNGPYNATVGYDLVTGLGSPLTTNFSPPASASVTLDAPSSGSRLLPSKVSFTYTPVSVGSVIQNSSLWTNATGSWALAATNATAVVNGTQDTMSCALNSPGTVVWNVEVFNSAGGAFASSNFTLTITSDHLLLTENPSGTKYAPGQSVTLCVDVLNQPGPPLNSTLTLTVTGPGGYYDFDFQTVNMTANSVWEYSFTWIVPSVAGTYVVEVGLVPPQLTAYDAAWLSVA
jgi:subtilase family serine protease